MKTKRRPEPTVNLVGCDTVLCERVRASLRRGPFSCTASEAPLPPAQVDLYVVAADAVGDLPRRGVPVVAWGPAARLRGAFLAGCDDYLRDPWSPEELELRALAVLGRTRARFLFPWGEVSLEGDALRTPGGLAPLTHHERLVLGTLLRARGRPVPRDALSLLATGTVAAGIGRAMDMHVASLRRKVRAVVPAAGRFITCVRGQGYMIP